MWVRRDAGAGSGDGARTRFPNMLPRRLRNPLIWSPIAAFVAQLLLAAVTAAATGGGDFPRIRVLLTVL
jgi:hypothetical protein